ncbi:hypothetical protein ABZ250_39400 [Streptomyces afghaniensis]|uniref:hypothetical protein n=1 Tax=Streptomyces afghaniensis TaxID=66865 RepID=UPI0033BE4DE0
MKARNVDAVVAGVRAAGARCLIVSGVVDPACGVHVDQIPQAAVTVCRLRADREVLRQRFTGRGGPAGLADEVLREADALDASTIADACVDTSGLLVNEVARRVEERTGGWPTSDLGRSADAPESLAVTAAGRSSALVQAEPSADLPVLWLCGPTGVGKSTVGIELYQRVLGAGATAAYLDLAQLGVCRPVPDDLAIYRLKARNLAAVWRDLPCGRGQCLIMSGPSRTRPRLRRTPRRCWTPGRLVHSLVPMPLSRSVTPKPDMPHPLGRLIDRPDENGRVGLTRPEKTHREATTPHQTFPRSETDVDQWREQFQVPDAAELVGGEIPTPPAGWSERAVDHWPSYTDS